MKPGTLKQSTMKDIEGCERGLTPLYSGGNLMLTLFEALGDIMFIVELSPPSSYAKVGQTKKGEAK
eukprot:5433480-Amphidinium_carterae.1